MIALRPELRIIAEWIEPGARVLDLGCGDGALLAHLMQSREVSGYGLEIDPANVLRCIENGVNVIEADIDAGLEEFGDQSFDYVVMSQALQALQHPDLAIREILRVGQVGVLTFPNFGHWRARTQLVRGRMPMTPALPSRWYSTENIHLSTVNDFEALCHEQAWSILRRNFTGPAQRQGWLSRSIPNLFAESALYMLKGAIPAAA